MADPATITFSERPTTGRLRFKLRTLSNWAACICAFISLAVLYTWLLSEAAAWIADAVTGVILYFTLFNVLQKRTIWIVCNHCLGRIATNRPWGCGDCDYENRDVDDFPFINRCGHCRAIPRAYECHHCLGIIFLSDDPDERNYAYALGSPSRKKPAKEAKTIESEEGRRKKEIDDVNYKIDKARREAELAQAEAFLKKVRGDKVPFEDDAKAKHREHLGRFEYARQRIEEAKIKYKGDPELFERDKAFWEEWREDISI